MRERFLSSEAGDGDQYTDQELIKKFKETADKKYFGLLFSRYSHLVYGTCRKYIDDREECRDLTMEIFEKAMLTLPNKEIFAFNNWIYSVSRNLCISRLRSTEKEVEETENWKYLKKKEPAVMENEAFLRLCSENKSTTAEIVESALGELDEDQQKCVRLFYFERKSYKSIQQQTGFTAKQVKSYLQNGKRRLRVIISKRIGDQ